MRFTQGHLRLSMLSSSALALLVDHDVPEFPTVLTALINGGAQSQSVPDEKLGRNRVQFLLDLVQAFVLLESL